MTYQDTLNWMFSKLPMYQRQGKAAYKADLGNTILLANHLNNPEKKVKCIHVAGTNGKGSTSHMIASILQESGLKVGLFTSPHLKDFRERIKINGVCVSEEFVIEFINQNKTFFESQALSFFEMTTGMAFEYFSIHQVDVAVIEVGLGGRLDSTNIITPLVSVITNIGLDHTQFLGNTLEEIANEKAGIIKPEVPVVVGEYLEATKPVFLNKAHKNKSEIYFAQNLHHVNFESDLKGSYQKHNIKTAVKTIQVLNLLGYKISDINIKKGLLNVVANTDLKGRWQVLQEKPKIICDTAHNEDGLKYVMNQLQAENYENLYIVFGVVNDKDLDSILKLLPNHAYYFFCKSNVPRGLDAHTLADQFIKKGFKGEICESVEGALNTAKSKASINDVIYVGGSTFTVAEII
ncbi:bifunctional folylpolyglutamate synthase/dihydrofolate synthase [Hanstruepera marina]|uniref:bifunctional folylpolyglutamate synthase/dihydrofolate synthase n=1 Tax=Hanstruepera marina TaxID=2873265 RepID=UPI001CA6186C|nr:folylpolyglutamate synthase/dihydrofolate synthase family protein [Hanstruepera marina]